MLLLKPITLSDAKNLYSASYDSDVRHYMPGCYCDSIEKATEYITIILTYPDVDVFVISTEKIPFIGIVILSDQGYEEGKKCYEISYFIDKKFRRKGYATNAVKHILQSKKSSRIYLSIQSSNIPSLSIAYRFNAIQKDDYYYYIDT